MADVERMYINGEWVLAEGGATFDVVNPADRTVVATLAGSWHRAIYSAWF